MFGKNKKEVTSVQVTEEKKVDKYPISHAVSYLSDIHGQLEQHNLSTSRKLHATGENSQSCIME